MEQQQQQPKVANAGRVEMTVILDAASEANAASPRTVKPKIALAIKKLEAGREYIDSERRVLMHTLSGLSRFETAAVKRAMEEAMVGTPVNLRDDVLTATRRARRTAIAQREASERETKGAKFANDARDALVAVGVEIDKLKRERSLPSSLRAKTPDVATLLHQNQQRGDVADLVRRDVAAFVTLYMSFRGVDPDRARQLRELSRSPLTDVARTNDRPGNRRAPDVEIQAATDALSLLRVFEADERAERPLDLALAEELDRVLCRCFRRLFGHDPALDGGGMTDSEFRRYEKSLKPYQLSAELDVEIAPGWLGKFLPALRSSPAHFKLPGNIDEGFKALAQRAETEL